MKTKHIILAAIFLPIAMGLSLSASTRFKGTGTTEGKENLCDSVYEKLPTVFVKNQGQVGEDILYYSWFPQGIIVYKDHLNIYGTDVKLKGSNLAAEVEGDALQQGIFNYFGNNQSISNIPSFGEVIYRNVYPHIALAIAGRGKGKIEFIWRVEPGGRVEDIVLEVKGATLKKTEKGEIEVFEKRKGKKLLFTISSIYAYQENYNAERDLPSPLSLGEGQGVGLYRLKQVDYDGKYEYFRVVSVNLDNCIENTTTIFPTISSGYFVITGNEKVSVGIYTLYGQMIFSEKPETLPLPFMINLSAFTGVLFIQFETGNIVETKKIIVTQ